MTALSNESIFGGKQAATHRDPSISVTSEFFRENSNRLVLCRQTTRSNQGTQLSRIMTVAPPVLTHLQSGDAHGTASVPVQSTPVIVPAIQAHPGRTGTQPEAAYAGKGAIIAVIIGKATIEPIPILLMTSRRESPLNELGISFSSSIRFCFFS